MTEQETIQGLKNLFSEHELDLPCMDSLEILHMAIEALEKQAGIKRALERLKKKEEEYLKEFRTRGHEELYGASWGFEEAIDIITEEVE